MSNPIYVAASARGVHLFGVGVETLVLTPDLADALSLELPRFALQSRALIRGQAPENDDPASMADCLRALGLRWRVIDPNSHSGYWAQNGEAVGAFGLSYPEATRHTFKQFVNS